MKTLYRGVLCGSVTFFAAGCDLALEPAQIPTSFEIAPNDTMITVGDRAKLRVVVYDQNGEEMSNPPSWAPPKWWTDSDGAVEISRQGDVTAHKGTLTRVRAFVADTLAEATLRVNPSSVLLSVPVFYFNQLNQNTERDVPIIANRKALFRVFLTGDETSYFRPGVRADFYLNGEMVHTVMMPAGADELPTRVVEENLLNSYGTVVPADVMQPGLELVIEVDPEGVVPRKAGSTTRIPESGRMPVDMLELKTHHQVIVPYIFNHRPDNDGALNWTRDLTPDSPHILHMRNLMPVADITVEAHEPVYSNINLQPLNNWGQWLRHVDALRIAEGQRGNYYGATELWYRGGILGLGYLGRPASVGDTNNRTFTHEVGHTLSLGHAKCGVGDPDPNYPYEDGRIGGWGYDLSQGLVHPTVKDIMSYCGGASYWLSDYYFARAANFRRRERLEKPTPPERTLLLWGSASRKEVQLSPAFLIESPPVEPAAGGPYRLEGYGPSGEVRFAFDFTPAPVDHGGAHFLFTLPYDPDVDGTLERIFLSGPGGEDMLTPGSTPPMAIIRDGPTGPIRAFLEDWDGRVPPGLGDPLQVQVMLSDGIPGGVR